MTTLIRKIANYLTSSLNIFFYVTLSRGIKATKKVTNVTRCYIVAFPTGLFHWLRSVRFSRLNQSYAARLIQVVLHRKFEISLGNPITIGDAKNDKN